MKSNSTLLKFVAAALLAVSVTSGVAMARTGHKADCAYPSANGCMTAPPSSYAPMATGGWSN